jgi:glucose-6-phosphate isomerase
MLTISYEHLKELDYQQYKERLSKVISGIEEKINQNDLGFLDLTNQDQVIIEINDYINSVSESFDTFLLIGIGGSALGGSTIHQSLGSKNNKNFFCIDNVDPDSLYETLIKINCSKTLVNVVSKSGGTPETIANFFIIYKYFKEKLNTGLSKHFVFTTDPKKGFLNKIAEKYDIKRFFIPENVGGRFSILTPVGLLMMAFLGHDLKRFLGGAEKIKQINSHSDFNENNILKLALNLHDLYMNKNLSNIVMMPYSTKLKELSNWFKQLWAESLGKKYDVKGNIINIGQTPISCVGATDQHSVIQLMMEGPKDKITVFIKVESFQNDVTIENPFPEFHDMDIYTDKKLSSLLNYELEATAFALNKEDRPSIEIIIPKLDEYYLGQLFFLFELLTAYSGELYEVNAFDQPGVEAGKIATKALLGQADLRNLKNEILKRS